MRPKPFLLVWGASSKEGRFSRSPEHFFFSLCGTKFHQGRAVRKQQQGKVDHFQSRPVSPSFLPTASTSRPLLPSLPTFRPRCPHPPLTPSLSSTFSTWATSHSRRSFYPVEPACLRAPFHTRPSFLPSRFGTLSPFNLPTPRQPSLRSGLSLS